LDTFSPSLTFCTLIRLTTALHEVGYTLTDVDPDFVVLGETRTYSFTAITKAIRLILGGARFIATNPDATGPSPRGAPRDHASGTGVTRAAAASDPDARASSVKTR